MASDQLGKVFQIFWAKWRSVVRGSSQFVNQQLMPVLSEIMKLPNFLGDQSMHKMYGQQKKIALLGLTTQ